jgi:hypothetical protein
LPDFWKLEPEEVFEYRKFHFWVVMCNSVVATWPTAVLYEPAG